MPERPVCPVDLRDPEVLDRVVKEHLRYSACPVDGQPFPGMLAPVTVVLCLPDGSERACEAQVVLRLGACRFIVQLMERLDVPFLAFLGRLVSRAGRGHRRSPDLVPGTIDSPFECVAVTPIRLRHLPAPEAGKVTARRGFGPDRLVQPPPRIGRASRLRRM